MDTKRRSLLHKYDIPISHLDFDYIKVCTNTKELERILTVLRSGEEGYFPDLTQFAENKLKELKPNSKILRTEEILPTKSRLASSEWEEANEPFIEWSNVIKIKDKFLSTISDTSPEQPLHIPPIREQTKKIEINQINKNDEIRNVQKATSDRIKATNYREWDKYDPDTEILKMELQEERIKEEVERKNKINTKKVQEISINPSVIVDEKTIINNLTNVEKDNLATRYKERGNDYFKAAEYENAIKEYTRCLNIVPSAAGYNNRAIAYLKVKEYEKCIQDCDKCIKTEPKNLKALLRKAQAFLGLDEKYKAFEVYTHIISIESSNVVARNHLNDLKSKLYFPPAYATRIQIQDQPGEVTNRERKSSNLEQGSKIQKENSVLTKQEKTPKVVSVQPEEDFSKLIVPNKIVKSKLASAVQTLGQLNKKKTQNKQIQKMKSEEKSEIKFFDTNSADQNDIFIQEIGN